MTPRQQRGGELRFGQPLPTGRQPAWDLVSASPSGLAVRVARLAAMLPPVGSRRLVGDPLVELLRVRKGRRALVRRRIFAVLVRRAGMRGRLEPAHARRRDRLLRLFPGVLLFGQPPTPCRFSQRSHAAMTMRAIAWRSRGSLTNSGTVNAAAVPSSRTSGTVRRPVSRSNSNDPYDQCSVPGTALMGSVTMPPYPARASRNRCRRGGGCKARGRRCRSEPGQRESAGGRAPHPSHASFVAITNKEEHRGMAARGPPSGLTLRAGPPSRPASRHSSTSTHTRPTGQLTGHR